MNRYLKHSTFELALEEIRFMTVQAKRIVIHNENIRKHDEVDTRLIEIDQAFKLRTTRGYNV